MILKIKGLVLARHIILKEITTIWYNKDQHVVRNSLENELTKWILNLKVISELLHVDIKPKDFFWKKREDSERIISYYLQSTVGNQEFFEIVLRNFGGELAEIYYFLSEIIAIHYISSFHIHGHDFDRIPTGRKSLVLSEYEEGDNFIKSFLEDFDCNTFFLHKYFSPEVISLIRILENHKKSDAINHKKIHEVTSEMINIIYPDYGELDYNLRKAHEYIVELKNCDPGIASWKKYENLSVKILRFLFIPDFNTIFFQSRTEDGSQIRDAILPNTKFEGFWNIIRNEYSSKNIIIEFKNGIKKGKGKDALNQLRIYLSKETIGKFGLLFIREKPSKSLLLARKLAYREAGILILLMQ